MSKVKGQVEEAFSTEKWEMNGRGGALWGPKGACLHKWLA